MAVTLEQASKLLDNSAYVIYAHSNFVHKTLKYADGKRHIQCRRNGATKLWKTRPNDFRIPVKYGLKECFYIECINGRGNFDQWDISD